METKWDVLAEEVNALSAKLAEKEAYLAGLDATPCGIICSGCDTLLVTEGDFARHFFVTDRRYLNLGWCPITDRSKIRN